MLNGINNKCAQCKGQCKQFKQVKVCYCPNYKALHPSSIEKRTGAAISNDNSKVRV